MRKLRFLVSLITESNDFQQQQAAAAEAAAKQAEVELQILYAEGDTITQSTQILKAIQAQPSLRPDGVIVEPAGGTGLPQVAKAASAAGIAWSLLNLDAEYVSELRKTARAPMFIVTSDHTEIGRIQARQFSALLPNGGSVLYIQGPGESAPSKGRTAGLEMVAAENLRFSMLRGKWTEESGQTCVASWLKLGVSNKVTVDAVGAQNDAMALGARKAFEQISNPIERERWLSLPFTGCDGLPKTGQAWVRTGLLTATVIIPPMAGQALQLMAQALRTGAKLPERTLTRPESFPPLENLSKKELLPDRRSPIAAGGKLR